MKTDTETVILRKKGSLTIEAALVLPIFLFMMVCVISLSALMVFQERLKECIHEEAKVIAMKTGFESVPGEEEVKENIKEGMGEYMLSIAPIKGGWEAIDFSDSDLGEEIVLLKADYEAELYYDMFHLFEKQFSQQSLFHTWRGYERGYCEHPENIEEEYVYITKDSEVYHCSRECSHILLNISEMSPEGVKAARNTSGAKYTSCEHCHSKLSDSTLYITPDGDCYHNTLSCSGLKRSVTAIPRSETGNRRPCSRCGY